jgi:hypothetical protein
LAFSERIWLFLGNKKADFSQLRRKIVEDRKVKEKKKVIRGAL